MNSAYDPTLKTLVEASPADWLPFLGLPRKRVKVAAALSRAAGVATAGGIVTGGRCGHAAIGPG
jgi:hypothetical protein